MLLTDKIKNALTWLNTSHGTHQVSRCEYGHDGHSFTDAMEIVNVPNKTPLQKIVLSMLVAGILAIPSVFITRKYLERREMFDRVVPSLYTLQYILNEQESARSQIKWMERANQGILSNYTEDIEHYKGELEKLAKRKGEFEQTIRKKLEKGYLTPSHEHYERYKKIFGGEGWWKETESERASARTIE